MYRCEECGEIFEEGEQAKWEETRGEYCGQVACEITYGCPVCRGEYRRVAICSNCERVFYEEDLTDGICEDCFELQNT